jgi:hypothetical protein
MDDNIKKGFISYSHRDEFYCNEIFGGLTAHSKRDGICLDGDWNIPLGVPWHTTLQDAIKNSEFSILLLSADCLASDYICQHEIPLFFNKYAKNKGFKCFIVKIRPCDTSNFPTINLIQHYKLFGSKFGLPKMGEITFSDLCSFDKEGVLIPNPNRDRFYEDFLKEMKRSLGI